MSEMEKDTVAAAAEETVKKEKKTKDSGKSKKSDKDKKTLAKRISDWFKDLKKEFKKVVWPTKKTVINNTLVVLAVVVVGSVIVGLLDLGFLNLMEFLMGLAD